MEAVIFGAGYGTRLKPITDTIPKICVPLFDQPFLYYTVRCLQNLDVHHIAVNAYHHAEYVKTAVHELPDLNVTIKLNVETSLLGTGGGLGALKKYIHADEFILFNGDIITTIQLDEALKRHRTKKALVTMILHDYPVHNKLKCDEDGSITDIENLLGTTKENDTQYAFTGIAIANKKIFEYVPSETYENIMEVYVSLVKAGQGEVQGCIYKDHYWRDFGTMENYWELHRDILMNNPFPELIAIRNPIYIGNGATVSADTSLEGFVSIGHHCSINAAGLSNCVVLPHTTVNTNANYNNCIIGPDFVHTLSGYDN